MKQPIALPNRDTHHLTENMNTRKHVHSEVFPVAPEEMFSALISPTAIQAWWSASQAIVLAEAGGTYAVTWGDSVDTPDYISVATIQEFEPPYRLSLIDFRYKAASGPLPFEAEFTTEFLVMPHDEGATLQVTQDGFPAGPEADDFYAGCETGWRDTFEGIRKYLANQ